MAHSTKNGQATADARSASIHRDQFLIPSEPESHAKELPAVLQHTGSWDRAEHVELQQLREIPCGGLHRWPPPARSTWVGSRRGCRQILPNASSTSCRTRPGHHSLPATRASVAFATCTTSSEAAIAAQG